MTNDGDSATSEQPMRASDLVGAKVKEHRLRLGLTREQLADRLQDLGSDISASVLVNIETGRPHKATGLRRRDATIDEVLVLAYALDVPPVVLFTPGAPSTSWVATDQGALSITPKVCLSYWDALTWVTGEEEPQDLEQRQRWRAATRDMNELRKLRTYMRRIDDLRRRPNRNTWKDAVREFARYLDFLASQGRPRGATREDFDLMIENDWLEHADEIRVAVEEEEAIMEEHRRAKS